MVEKGATGPPARSFFGRAYWLIAMADGGRLEALTITLPGGEEALPVFGFAEEAEMFLWLEGPKDAPWRIRRTSTGELISVLYALCADVERVALDPSPKILAGAVSDSVFLSRERFLERVAGGKRSMYRRRDTAAPRLTRGYSLDRSDPDVLFLRRRNGSVVAAFSARGATAESIQRAVEADPKPGL
jgi:hypothetical protein